MPTVVEQIIKSMGKYVWDTLGDPKLNGSSSPCGTSQSLYFINVYFKSPRGRNAEFAASPKFVGAQNFLPSKRLQEEFAVDHAPGNAGVHKTLREDS